MTLGGWDQCAVTGFLFSMRAARRGKYGKERPINGAEPGKSKDDMQSEQLGPRGVRAADPMKTASVG